MTTQLVETSEEDSFLAVARYIGDLLNEGEVCCTLCCLETPSCGNRSGVHNPAALGFESLLLGDDHLHRTGAEDAV